MPARREKVELVLTTKEDVSKKIPKSTSAFKEFASAVAVGNLAAKAGEKAIGLLKDGLGELVEATKVAARIQVLNRVLLLTGKNAGYSERELKRVKSQIIKLGIAENEALAIEQRFIQGKLKIADATKIARAAQDLAVISGTNSSEAALTLTEAIVKQQPILLKQFGIMLNQDQVYSKYAKTLKKSRDELTQTERRTAFMNEILKQATTVSGSYEEAMNDVGKRITSLPRHLQNAENAIGKLFLVPMKEAVDATEGFLKAVTFTAEGIGNFFNIMSESSETQEQYIEYTQQMTTEINDLVTQLKAGEIGLEEFRVKMDQVGKEDFKIKDAGDVRKLLKKNYIDSLEEINDAYKKNEISFEEWVNKQQQIMNSTDPMTIAEVRSDALIKMAKETRDAVDADLAAARKSAQQAILDSLDIQTQKLEADLRALGLDAKTIISKAFDETVNKDLENEDVFMADIEPLRKNLQERMNLWDEQRKNLHEAEAIMHEASLIGTDALYQELSQLDFDYIIKKRELMAMSFADEVDQKRALRALEEIHSDKKLAIVQKFNDDAKADSLVLAGALGNIMMSGVDQMVDALFEGRKDFSDIFEGMAKDFIKFFVKQGLAALANSFVPGLGSILGGMFDTPKYDRMAMTQGEHFINWFDAGARKRIGQLPIGDNLVLAGSNIASGSYASAPNESGSGGGTTQIFNGVVSEDFLTAAVLPRVSIATKRNEISITTNTNDKFGESSVFS